MGLIIMELKKVAKFMLANRSSLQKIILNGMSPYLPPLLIFPLRLTSPSLPPSLHFSFSRTNLQKMQWEAKVQ